MEAFWGEGVHQRSRRVLKFHSLSSVFNLVLLCFSHRRLFSSVPPPGRIDNYPRVKTLPFLISSALADGRTGVPLQDREAISPRKYTSSGSSVDRFYCRFYSVNQLSVNTTTPASTSTVY